MDASNLVRDRERETMGSRAGEGWDGWGQWQLSTAETRTDWRSDRPVVLDVPSAAIFLSSASAHCAVAHVRLRWWRRRGLFAVGENFLFSSLAFLLSRVSPLSLFSSLTWQLGQQKGVFPARQNVVEEVILARTARQPVTRSELLESRRPWCASLATLKYFDMTHALSNLIYAPCGSKKICDAHKTHLSTFGIPWDIWKLRNAKVSEKVCVLHHSPIPITRFLRLLCT